MFTYKERPIKAKLIQAFQKVKIGRLEPGMVLLYILPPIGIAWLLLMGLVQIYRVIRWRTPIDFTVGIFFLFKFVDFFYRSLY